MDGYTYGLLTNVNRNNRDAAREMMRAQGIIDDVARERDEAWAENAKLRSALAFERAHSWGVLANVRALKVELRKVNPGNRLLALTGRTFLRANVPETGLSSVYHDAFREKCLELGVKPSIEMAS